MNSELKSIYGLNNIIWVKKDLELLKNTSLTNVGGSLLINSNNKLANLYGLNNITSIGGNLRISGNNLIESLDSLSNLSVIGD